MGSTGDVAIRMLGHLRLERAGRSLGPDDFEGRKPKQVLEILLVHHGDAVPKERLADLLWGQAQPRDPMRTLEAYVAVLRRALGPDDLRDMVVTGQGSYRVNVDVVDLDLRRF